MHYKLVLNQLTNTILEYTYFDRVPGGKFQPISNFNEYYGNYGSLKITFGDLQTRKLYYKP